METKASFLDLNFKHTGSQENMAILVYWKVKEWNARSIKETKALIHVDEYLGPNQKREKRTISLSDLDTLSVSQSGDFISLSLQQEMFDELTVISMPSSARIRAAYVMLRKVLNKERIGDLVSKDLLTSERPYIEEHIVESCFEEESNKM